MPFRPRNYHLLNTKNAPPAITAKPSKWFRFNASPAAAASVPTDAKLNPLEALDWRISAEFAVR
jgi:hypothetical protein